VVGLHEGAADNGVWADSSWLLISTRAGAAVRLGPYSLARHPCFVPMSPVPFAEISAGDDANGDPARRQLLI
jgi:hypothetical protein